MTQAQTKAMLSHLNPLRGLDCLKSLLKMFNPPNIHLPNNYILIRCCHRCSILYIINCHSKHCEILLLFFKPIS